MVGKMGMQSTSELNDETVRNMSIAAVFSNFVGKINSIDFHRIDDLLVIACEDDSVRFYDIANAKVVSLCMSPTNDSFMSGSLDRTVRMWDLQGPFDTFLVGLRSVILNLAMMTYIVFIVGISQFQYTQLSSICFIEGSGNGNLHASNPESVMRIEYPTLLHWHKLGLLISEAVLTMFVAASIVLTFWISNPNPPKSTGESATLEPDSGAQPEQPISQ
ncbi:WD40 repeat [Dillenia turbinata]|uniref:WD40 repeat n=1 Tax=Dillenia turbinata TaxID=194707 RepID=A0AAN8YXE7_9MAGN